MNKEFVLALLLLSAPLAADSAPAPAADTNAPPSSTIASMDLLDDRHKLGPGDRLTYRVIEDRDEPRSLAVTDSGDLEVPYYGLVQAAGKTSRQLANDVKILLEQKLYHRATVIVAVETVNRTRILGRVYVTGQVRNTGGYDIPAGESFTVTRAILNAGGFSDFSDKKNVRVFRNTPSGRKAFVVNVASIWDKGKLEEDMTVEPDDLIVVPARLVNF